MANKKMTKRDYFEQIKAKYNLSEDEIKFIDHEIELLNKKSESKGLTDAQKENERIKAIILEALTEKMSISQINKTVPECADFSTSKTSALVRQLKEIGAVIRTEEKGVAYFVKA